MKRVHPRSLLPIWTLLAAACAATDDGASSAHKNELAAAGGPALALSDQRTVAPASEDARVVADLIELARRENRVQDHLRHLCLSIGPRLTSSHNLAQAQQWTLDQFRAWGLDAKLEPWGEFPVGFDRGPFRGGIVGDPSVEFAFTTRSWTAGTKGPLRGRALVKPKTEEELAKVKDLLPGAWLLVPPSARRGPGGQGGQGGPGGQAGPGGQGAAGGRGEATAPAADPVAEAIAAAGIAGEIQSAGRDLVITSGNHRITWDKLPTLPRVVLRDDQYKDVLARIEKGVTVELEFDIDNRFYEGPVQQFNVLADIRGTEFPDEYVIVGGHLDSWDGAQGAVDNGTGCATTLEAARLLMAVGARPRRTIRFALWSGEEQGLFGSEGYVRDHKAELEKISAVYIHDGGTNYLSGLGITYDMEEQLRKVCAPLADLDPAMPFKLRASEGFRFSADSDHAPFADAGVPGFFWDQDGKSDYNHMHHTQHDTFETAVPEYQQHSALVAAITAFNTANLGERLCRDNFKAVPPRRAGASLDGTRVARLSDDGKAAAAGWKVDDVVSTVDGVAIAKREQLNEELQKGGARKVVVLRRGEESLETVLDFTADKEEVERTRRAELRAAKQQGSKQKFW